MNKHILWIILLLNFSAYAKNSVTGIITDITCGEVSPFLDEVCVLLIENKINKEKLAIVTSEQDLLSKVSWNSSMYLNREVKVEESALTNASKYDISGVLHLYRFSGIKPYVQRLENSDDLKLLSLFPVKAKTEVNGKSYQAGLFSLERGTVGEQVVVDSVFGVGSEICFVGDKNEAGKLLIENKDDIGEDLFGDEILLDFVIVSKSTNTITLKVYNVYDHQSNNETAPKSEYTDSEVISRCQ